MPCGSAGKICSMAEKPRQSASRAQDKARSKYARSAGSPSTAPSEALAAFLDLVEKLGQEASFRSENELSRRLANVLEERGLSTVVDTSPRGSRKRPDILGYSSALDADLVLQADVAVEAKLPGELKPGTSITDALVDQFWSDKTFPYVTRNLSRIQYFILTTFREHAVLRVSDSLRAKFATAAKQGDVNSAGLQAAVRKNVETFSLGGERTAARGVAERRWISWLDAHLASDKLSPVPLSTLSNIRAVETEVDLEEFAARLAEIAAGNPNAAASTVERGLFLSLRERVAPGYVLASDAMIRDVRLFVMAQNASADAAMAANILERDPARWINEFVAASIHSLISRLFALKVIEDAYCVGQRVPLIEEHLWVVNTPDYNGLSADELLAAVTRRMRNLTASKNPLVKGMAVFGAFFDWVTEQIDPVIFRTLFELFVVHDFRSLQGDLLGRFFEVYSQRINRTTRRELGQYYTPLPVVQFMWHLAEQELNERGWLDRVSVLDPGMGSGTFLREGARRLAELQVPRFWERLVGFDISPQVLGIAQLNLYMATLLRVAPRQAYEIKDLRVYTTDALDPRNGKHLKALAPLFPDVIQREFLRRAEISAATKRDERFWLVIGNPPYKNNAALTLSQAAVRFPTLLGSSAAVAKAQTRYIRDDYAWFFGAADAYVQSEGMVVYVTSDSYLSHESYRLFRLELLRHYEIRKIVRLGAGLFRDVGPNISFVICVLVRREAPLVPAACEHVAVDYFDLRALADAVPQAKLGTDEDPRLLALNEFSRGRRRLDGARSIAPTAKNQYALVPLDRPVVARVMSAGVPVSAKSGDRIFTQKWPGIITAFDALLKDSDRAALARKMSKFIEAARSATGRKRSKLVQEFAVEHEIDGESVERLQLIAEQVANNGIAYRASNVKRTFSGSIPNASKWYPPPTYRHFVYYEPRIKIPRNANPGKEKGWGSMEQWRDPDSHLIHPKLIFTTSSNPQYGLKAFVVEQDWYVKLHGGKSQQYNYTGLSHPGGPARTISGAENNLHDAGARLQALFVKSGKTAESILHFVAGLYNSALAEEFQNTESGQPFLVRIPEKGPAVAKAVQVAEHAVVLRDLHRLLYDGPTSGAVERPEMETFAGAATLDALGVRWRTTGGGRFKATETWELPEDWAPRIVGAIDERQEAIDECVAGLYS